MHVDGHSDNELTWDWIMARAPHVVKPERTTVTGMVRRISEMDFGMLGRMAAVCRPDFIALTFLDYVDPDLYMSTDKWRIVYSEAVNKTTNIIDRVAGATNAPVKWVSTGPGVITDRFE